MRAKRSVNFRIAPNKLTGKGKEKEVASSVPSLDDGWVMSKFIESDIQSLVDECLLQSRETLKWWSALGHTRPFEETNEIVLFLSFFQHGFGIPTTDF